MFKVVGLKRRRGFALWLRRPIAELEVLSEARIQHTRVSPAASMLRVLDVETRTILFHPGERISTAVPGNCGVAVGESLTVSDPRLKPLLQREIARRAQRISRAEWASAR